MLRKLLLLVVLVLLFGVSILPAAAFNGGFVKGTDWYCDPAGTFFGVRVHFNPIGVDRDNTGFGLEAGRIFVYDGNGVVLHDSFNYNPVGTTINEPLDGDGAPFPFFLGVPTANPIRFQLVSQGWNGFSEQVLWDFTGDCPGLPTVETPPVTALTPNRGIPSNFVHRRIDCETPVYNLPGGQPVGNAVIHFHQTWFVSPYPVEAYDGTSWTEIYNASYPNPFIPTECVNPDRSLVVPMPPN